ncbi:ATP-binding protein [Mycobacterium sp.]|uniref:ATP-binding protein n=1 Tax=Mycobacterium sp. TaxID=1785 RepID=UPI0025DC2819|nr:ATP-binding protein [Mycobacterium sp.]
MTLTDDDMSDAPACVPSGPGPRRRPITDVKAWLDDLDIDVAPTLRALGELLLGVSQRERAETDAQFTARTLEVGDFGQLVAEERPLNPVSRLTAGLALAEWINEHAARCEIGPGEHTQPPKWTQTLIGADTYRHPLCVRVFFPANTLLSDTGCVVAIEARQDIMRVAEVSAYVTPAQQTQARVVLDRLVERANALNPYRGHAVRAVDSQGLSLSIIDLPATATRRTIIAPQKVWAEVDLGLTAVRDHHALLNAHGLGARRGILLCGPPGTGKSAICAVLANEVVGEFTVIYVEAQAGARLLTAVVEEAQRIGGPVLLVLEDVDLWISDRRTGGGGLSELLQAMDIRPDARILTVASTNDATTLDKAAIRTGRFDSVIEVGYPTRSDAARILTALTDGIPGADTVDAAAVATALPEHTSGSDIREIVRRAVLAADHAHLTTAALLTEIGAGRYRAQPPAGQYL